MVPILHAFQFIRKMAPSRSNFKPIVYCIKLLLYVLQNTVMLGEIEVVVVVVMAAVVHLVVTKVDELGYHQITKVGQGPQILKPTVLRRPFQLIRPPLLYPVWIR